MNTHAKEEGKQDLKLGEFKRPMMVEPSYMEEFREISSEYLMESKHDSERISSDGEFNVARNI